MEEWRIIKDFPDYKMTKFGQIQSKHGRILSTKVRPDGYAQIGLYRNKKLHNNLVRKLLRDTFSELFPVTILDKKLPEDIIDPNEIWKVILGFPDYEVSSKGRLRGPFGISKASPDKDGYVRVSIYDINGIFRTKTMHKLVCTTFHGSPPVNKPLALHKDDVKHNNNKDNLYWGTHKENAADRIANSLLRI